MKLVNLEQLFFPVGLHEAYWDKEEWEAGRIDVDEQTLFHDPNRSFNVSKSYRHLAVVDEANQYVFAYVTKTDYHLITNKDVYEFGLSLVRFIFFPFDGNVSCFGRLSESRGTAEISYVDNRKVYHPEFLGGWRAIITVKNSYNKSCGFSATIGFLNESYNVEWRIKELEIIKAKTFHAVSSDELLKAIKSSDPVKEIRRNGIESVLQEYLDKLRNIRFANRWLVYLLVKFFRICGPDGTILIKDLNYIIGVLKKHNFSDYVSGEDLLGILMETTVGYPGKLSSDMNFSGNPDALGDLMKDIENHNLDEGNVQGYVGKSIIRAVDELLNDNMDSDGFIEMMPA